MKNNSYNSLLYKEKQSIITKTNWKKGIYDSLRKREKRQCTRKECERVFEVKPSDKKRFCSRSCAMKVNNLKRSKASYDMKERIERLLTK